MPEPERKTSKSIPRSRLKAAAIAAGVVAGIFGAALGEGALESPGLQPVDFLDVFAMTAFVFAGMFLMILFVLLLMQSGIEWNKRGGKPDPFTRDGS